MKKEREAFLASAGELYDEVSEWRRQHPKASLDEIVAQVRPKRQGLMGELVGMVALQGGNGVEATGCRCGECGEEMRYKGELKRTVVHGEGVSALQRAHYYCARCQSGFFPPRPATAVGEA